MCGARESLGIFLHNCSLELVLILKLWLNDGFVTKCLELLICLLESLKAKNSICFQGVVWTNMKLLWQRVLPMLRCRRIVVPLRLADGFDNLISSLEGLMMLPEVIDQHLFPRKVE
jgi:hypothetical protein